jgi:lysine 2,3-aminomutase
MLRKYHPLWINTQFNHPKELTLESIKACADICDAGIPLGNQSVLLKGINDDSKTMKELVLGLVKARVRPYYLYQCDLNEGIGHFRTKVETGIGLIRDLTGYISGFAVPKYVIDAPGGGGKVPMNPEYLISSENGRIDMRNYEGKQFTYTEYITD